MSHRHHLPCRVLMMFTLLPVAGCGGTEAPPSESPKSNKAKEVKTMRLTSSKLEHGAQIDAVYTADGEDVSPPLSWSGVPEGTESLALICDDPDAPSPKRPAPEPWVHWVLFNIPADVTHLPPGMSAEAEPEKVPGARQGVNSSSNMGYQGPAPPAGSGHHRYFFKLYALDTILELPAGTTTKKELLDAMSGHILAEGELMGVYER